MYQLSLPLLTVTDVDQTAFGSFALTDASAALFLAFGDRCRRHRAQTGWHIG